MTIMCHHSSKYLSAQLNIRTCCWRGKSIFQQACCHESLLISVCSPVSDMLRYTACVREWMAADSRNVIAIHCKGGKGMLFDGVLMLYVNTVWNVQCIGFCSTGRTGTMVCTWLIDSDQFESAQVRSGHECWHVETFSSKIVLNFL